MTIAPEPQSPHMVPRRPLPVVLCCRMNEHLDSWVHLRAVGEWFDVTHALESVPQASAVLALSGLLVDQLRHLNHQLARALRTGQAPDGLLLAALACPELLAVTQSRAAVVCACRRALADGPFGAWPTLARLDAEVRAGRACWTEPLARDYLVWTHLAHISAALREGDPRVASLAARARDFSAADARELAAALSDAIASLIPRWRRMLGNGQIEIAAQAYSGAPIDDWLAARQAVEYPGGDDRARWQVARTLQTLVGAFGVRPRGFVCGPCESGPLLGELLASFGIHWSAAVDPEYGAADAVHAATGGMAPDCALAAWPSRPPRTFAAPDALTSLTEQLRGIEGRQDLRLITGAELPPGTLPTPVQTARKRRRILRRRSYRAQRQWLVDAKQIFDQVVVEGNLSDDQQRLAEQQLARCEAADWLEGRDGPAFARQIAALYRILHEAPPDDLATSAGAARAA